MERVEKLEKENLLLKEVISRARLQDRNTQRILNGFLKVYGFELLDLELKNENKK